MRLRFFARFPFALLAAAAVFGAGPARAADGQILITQAKAVAGGVTPGDKPGFPVTISARGSYKLAGNLSPTANKDGIVANATEVSIDLNGFSIDGGSVALNAIVGNQRSLTVRNGTIRAFKQYGIITRGSLSIVEDMRISENGQAGLLVYNTFGGYSRVTDSTFFANASYGISCSQTCHIEGNLISNNGFGDTDPVGGLYINNGTVLGNTISGNARYGIIAVGNSTGFGNNTIFNNNNGGVQVGGGTVTIFPNACFPTAC